MVFENTPNVFEILGMPRIRSIHGPHATDTNILSYLIILNEQYEHVYIYVAVKTRFLVKMGSY